MCANWAQKPESRNEALVKSPKDMLLFSKKARQVAYKPCTLKEYRETKPTGYVELGKLQPDLYTDELVAKVKRLLAEILPRLSRISWCSVNRSISYQKCFRTVSVPRV